MNDFKQTRNTFFVILAFHLAGIAFEIQLAEYISKPMIAACLGLYFLSQIEKIVSGLRTWIVCALIFSWIGDVVLLMQPNGSVFFLLGLSAFLIAHIFYIIFFHQVRVKERIKANAWLVLMVAAYYFGLILFLSPHLGDMRLPVRIYGIVISFMFMLAMHTLFIKNKAAGRRMMIGAMLFLISDSILAINKFYQPFRLGGLLVMLSYGLAQFFIVEGAICYIRNQRNIDTSENDKTLL